jgi:hypothetical protein
MRDGDNGLLVDIGDVSGFVSGFRRLTADRALAARVVDGGERALLTGFSEAGVSKTYMDLFAARPQGLLRVA